MERLDALTNEKLRTTLLFVRSRARPVTVDDVAHAIGAPRSAARWRLEKLAAAGLLATGFERRSGRSGPGAGRPAKTYAAAVETKQVEFPPRRYETLVALILADLPRRGRAARLSRIGVSFGEELARAARLRPASTLATAGERLCRGLGGLGFHASLECVADDAAVVVTATCPLRPLVLESAEAQAIDRGMWRALVAAVAEDRSAAGIRCRTENCFDRDSPCRIRLTFRPGGSTSV
jgi:predicted ArsR family transcriptional regulator